MGTINREGKRGGKGSVYSFNDKTIVFCNRKGCDKIAYNKDMNETNKYKN